MTITLVKPSTDFLSRLTTPFFCPVPTGTPFIGGGPYIPDHSGGGTIISDGPYYVADSSSGAFAILKKNPNYPGPRPRHFETIMVREDVAAPGALSMVATGAADGVTYLPSFELRQGGPADRRWAGTRPRSSEPRYHLTRSHGHTIAQLIGPRIECRIFTPQAFGLDLAAICPNQAAQ